MVAVLLTGVESLVAFIKLKPNASLYYLNGFDRLEVPHKAFLVHGAIVSRVMESALLELLDDSRVPLIYDKLWEVLAEEMLWVINLGVEFWAELAGVAQEPVEDLRSGVIYQSHVSFHFFWRRVLEPQTDYPRVLCRGDLEVNLEELHGVRGLMNLTANGCGI